MKQKFLIVLLFILAGQNIWAGHSVGNGGDRVAAEFTLQARKAILHIPPNSKALAEISYNLREALGRTTVRSEPHVYVNNREVDAANYPKENLIIVNSSRWKPRADHAVLGVHEYLWIAGYDDSTYELSQILVGLSQIPFIPPAF
jgi:hypothetical protein